MSSAPLCTRGDVKSALGSATTARDDAQVDRAVYAASDAVVSLCHREFAPCFSTRTVYGSGRPGVSRFGDPGTVRSGYVLLSDPGMISLSSTTSDGNPVTGAALAVLGGASGPPYDLLDLSAASARGGTLAVSGLFGYTDDQAGAGTLASSVDGVTTTFDLSVSSPVGALLKVGTERVLVTERSALTTGRTLAADLAALTSATLLTLSGAGPVAGEVVTVDGERMLVVDSAGSTVTVRRAWDGSTLAAHSTGATVYAARRATVTRAAAGSTAAAHTAGDAVSRWLPPALVRSLAVAEAVQLVQQEQAGYAAQTGSGDSARPISTTGLPGLRAQVYARFGRGARAVSV